MENLSVRETKLAELEVIKASAREMEMLKKGGYIK
jgi:hypothetical protein